MICIVRTFGAPVIDPLGKSARNTSGRLVPGSSSRRHGRRELPDGLEALRLEHLGPPDRAGLRDPTEVVAEQVDDHRVLGAVLHGGGEPLADRVVLREPATPRRRALHRARGERVAVQTEEQLRRGARGSGSARRSGRRRARLVARSRGRGRGRARRPARVERSRSVWLT